MAPSNINSTTGRWGAMKFRKYLTLAALVVAALTGGVRGSRAAVPMRDEHAPGSTQDPAGRQLYQTNCRSCHGAVGVPPRLAIGRYPRLPNLTDPAFWENRSVDSVVVVLQKGVGRDMRPFTDKLSLEEMRTVALYARGLSRPR